jgi:hypothetical protein
VLNAVLELAQDTFIQHHFISSANVAKLTALAQLLPKGRRKQRLRSQRLTVTGVTALGPLERCNVCTLLPPCAHISESVLVQRGVQRRAELPQRGSGSLPCQTFVKKGYCPHFNRVHHCRYVITLTFSTMLFVLGCGIAVLHSTPVWSCLSNMTV